VYADDSDMRVPSSDLSTVSASSSNMGSPASHHGQLAQMPEWAAPHGLGLISPGIVDQNEYFSGHDYSFGNSIDGYNAQFEFAQPKGPGFVGEFPQLSRSPQSPSRQGQTPTPGSISSSLTSRGVASRKPAAGADAGSGLALDTQLAQAPVSPSSNPTSAAPSRRASLGFASPSTSTSSFSSPPPPTAWSASSPIAARSQSHQSGRLVSPFFSQSSGHFVAPLGASCWFLFCQKLHAR
jgi:hypothetical protein